MNLIDTAPEWITRDWERYQHWAQLCAAGACRYRDLDGSHATAPWLPKEDEREYCPGYQGSLHREDMGWVIRSRACARRAAWDERRRAFVREERRRQSPGKALSGWKGD